MTNGGFIKFMRSDNARELLKRPKCFALLAQIAQRARRSGELNIHDLGTGEALVGDRDSIGLTQQEYRTAKKFLEKHGLAAFRVTNRGTIARLKDQTIFDINLTQDNQPANRRATSWQQPANEQVTTNKNEKKKKKDKNEKKLKEYRNFKKNFVVKKTIPQPTYEEVLAYR